ncbi:MAG: hypothetical protein ACR2P5_06240 [Gammaproteobacteria bacterium]
MNKLFCSFAAALFGGRIYFAKSFRNLSGRFFRGNFSPQSAVKNGAKSLVLRRY